MNDNNRDQSSPSDHASTEPPHLQPDHVYLRVIYLVTGDPRPPQNLGQVNLNTTVLALKARIQHDLPEHPPPSEQRLIYQGRPLLRNEATLREVLRLESGAPSGPLPYTIHIVINPRQDAEPPTDRPNPLGIPSSAGPRPSDRSNPFRAVETSAARLQESLARIQQQIEVNRADLMNVQQRIGLQHHNMHHHIAIGHPIAIQPPLPMGGNGHATFATPTPLRFHPGQPLEQTPNDRGVPTVPFVHAQNIRGHGQPIPPMFRNSAVPTQPTQHVLAPLAGQPTTPASSQPNGHDAQATHGAHTATEAHYTTTGLPLPQTGSLPGTQQPEASTQYQSLIGALPTSGPTMVSQLPAHFAPQFTRLPPTSPLPPGALAWIISSPSGPEALLFQAGHGFFSTSQPQSLQPPTSQSVSARSGLVDHHSTTEPVPPVVDNDLPNINARRAQPRRDPRPAVPALVQARQNPADNDLFAFFIQRGWLFLRLYLFMFVFSEPGTWKRWLLIVIAAVVCLQPRTGPLARGITAARRHFNNLIAPPAPRPLAVDARETQPQPHVGLPRYARDDANTQRPANVRGAVHITPEEAAARLIGQQQDRAPTSWRDAFYRIEQSTALFLASLVPGVGERYVRVREEARREAERLEQERVHAREEAAARTQAEDGRQGQPSDTVEENAGAPSQEQKVTGTVEQSTSACVQVAEDAAGTEGLRNRTA